ncbi:Glutathione S-transferase GST-6.0 [Pseudocercospora fuligena]|uniref:Glutathione S-transferase GST-6.0 n=1 Tax=Pseudocercospora fuligena TaxID=685502 RepID=A0A8H6RQM1_9PEZI|nr:Glutathione S-transferase GST-6.0 [Pseudocercospora fuligena]
MTGNETDWDSTLEKYISFSRDGFQRQLEDTTVAAEETMPEITLYRADGSCSMAANAILKELQIPYKSIRMQAGQKGFAEGYQGTTDGSMSIEEYKRKINPSGHVPALVVDGDVITENPAILTYLGSLKPDRRLLGSTSLEQIRVLEWLVWLSGSLHSPGFGAYLRPYRFSDDESSFESIKEKGRKTILQCYSRIEARVDGKHAVGDRLTVVDVFLHVFYRWAKLLDLDMESCYPRWTELVREVESLQSLQDAMKEERETLLFSH